jgi:signal transduction histidine kinase
MGITCEKIPSLQTFLRILAINCGPSHLSVVQEFAGSSLLQLVDSSETPDLQSQLESKTFDLAILETSKVPQDGLSLVQALRRHPPRLLLLILGDSSQTELLSLLDYRTDFCLVEPVRPEILRLTLNQLAQRIALENELEGVSMEVERRGQELSESMERQKEVTAEKDLTYRELLLAYSRLQDVNQKKNNFLSMATHELRTPVTVIKGYHRILLDDRLGKLLPEQRKVLMESEENCNRLIKIINSLLNLSRIETGRLELIYQESDFVDHVRGVVVDLKGALTRKGLSAILNLETGIPKFKYDREKITQVLTNLLENSIKYTPEGGKVYLSAEPYFWERRNPSSPLVAENKRTRVSTPSTASAVPFNAVKVEVSDTGIGISPQHHQEIFEEFTQVVASHSNKSSGLGLGLAISKRIIEAHGGKIWVESQVNLGSKFVFLLPFSPMESPL